MDDRSAFCRAQWKKKKKKDKEDKEEDDNDEEKDDDDDDNDKESRRARTMTRMSVFISVTVFPGNPSWSWLARWDVRKQFTPAFVLSNSYTCKSGELN